MSTAVVGAYYSYRGFAANEILWKCTDVNAVTGYDTFVAADGKTAEQITVADANVSATVSGLIMTLLSNSSTANPFSGVPLYTTLKAGQLVWQKVAPTDTQSQFGIYGPYLVRTGSTAGVPFWSQLGTTTGYRLLVSEPPLGWSTGGRLLALAVSVAVGSEIYITDQFGNPIQ